MDAFATAVFTITLIIKPVIEVPITDNLTVEATGLDAGYELRIEPVKDGKQYKVIEAK